MKLKKVTLEELPNKHYHTDIEVELEGHWSKFSIQICGEGSEPSQREVDNLWEPEFGMNHVESVEHEYLAQVILEALQKECDYE